MDWQERITIDPGVLVGKPIIKGHPHLRGIRQRECLEYGHSAAVKELIAKKIGLTLLADPPIDLKQGVCITPLAAGASTQFARQAFAKYRVA